MPTSVHKNSDVYSFNIWFIYGLLMQNLDLVVRPEVKTGLLLTQKIPLLNQGKTVFFTPKLPLFKKSL
jgi:hypothetical protein